MEDVILYIGGFELPDKNAAAHRVINNAKIMKALGKRVIFVGVNKSLYTNLKFVELPNKKDYFGFECYEIPYPNSISKWVKNIIDIKVYQKLSREIGNVKAIICYNFPAFALKRLNRFCKSQQIKCYADVTEWYSVYDRNVLVKVVKNFDTWYRMKIVHRKLDGLIVISRYLEDYYSDCDNVVYLPTLTDSKEEKWKSEHEKDTEVLRLVYAGNPGRKDRIEILIEALGHVNRQYILDVIGIEKTQYLNLYSQHREFLNSNNSIIFHGRIGHKEALHYVKTANYSCFFRLDDRVSKAGFPTKFAEAITCGTPIIANRTSNVDEYLSENFNGYLVDELDSTSIAKLIEGVPYNINVNINTFDYRNFEKEIIKLFRIE